MTRPPAPALPASVEGTGADTLLADAERDLKRTMRRRANGSWHIPNCREYHVNSVTYPCAEKCLAAQATLRAIRAHRAACDGQRFMAALDGRLGRIRTSMARRRITAGFPLVAVPVPVERPRQQQAALWSEGSVAG